MKPKEQFLENLKAKIKLYKDAYDYNKDLPDDLFEALNGSFHISEDKPPPAETSTEYGANIQAVRDIITKAGRKGIRKKEIKELFPYEGNVETIVTNALSSLNKAGEIEGFKPTGETIKGFYWRLKA